MAQVPTRGLFAFLLTHYVFYVEDEESSGDEGDVKVVGDGVGGEWVDLIIRGEKWDQVGPLSSKFAYACDWYNVNGVVIECV